MGPLASYLALLSLPWFLYPRYKCIHQNANYYSLATLQVSDIGRPCVKPFPYVISLNSDNALERGVGSAILCFGNAHCFTGLGPGQCPPHLSFNFPTEHRPHFSSPQPNTSSLCAPTLAGFYFIYFQSI